MNKAVPSHPLTTRDQTTEFLLYTAPNGAIKVEVLLNNETIWLAEYKKFNKQQRIESDFDRQMKRLLHKGSAQE